MQRYCATARGTVNKCHMLSGDFGERIWTEELIGPGPFGMEEKLPRRILAANGLEYVAVSRSKIPLQ